MTHPAILAYEQTKEKDFPLIMVIAREPNNNSISDGSIGGLPFERFSKCGLWNIAFSLFGYYNSKNIKEIKRLFIDKKASPIIFTDASPYGLLNEMRNKGIYRNQLSNEHFDEQIKVIFHSHDIIKRVKMILLTGLENKVYSYFKNEVEKRASSFSITCVEIPFLFGNNMPQIKQRLSEKPQAEEKIKSVFKDFDNSN